jgi:amino acid transporter
MIASRKAEKQDCIAFSAVLAIGLFLQSGKVIFLAGLSLAIIAYLLAGSMIWYTMVVLGEMTASFPIQGDLVDFPARFLNDEVGCTVGWISWSTVTGNVFS